MPADQAKSSKRNADCVVLCPPGVEPDAELLAALDRRELTIRRARPADSNPTPGINSEYAAMAAVCTLMKATVADVRAGRESRGVILLIVEPRLIDKAPDLVHAIERYAPHAAIWCYQATSSPRMSPVTPDDVSSWLDPDHAHSPDSPQIRPVQPSASLNSPSARTQSATPAHPASPVATSVTSHPALAHPMLPDHRVFLDLDQPRQSGKPRKDREPLSQAELSMLLADEPSVDHNGSNGHGEIEAGRSGASRRMDQGLGGD